ncbi:MAG: hypothetical protein UT56_C0023G0002 [Candidatus Levybacteria bacterium GW2011_GWB1_39_7]|nr:MAG: hypothetical protein UT20_C0043G0002 [Candidatus Levybacteria bacterium GW2011_GWA1_39_11]KKR24196.1 MAG: hypothetical protein UT56_C0023G0002 [Candidatus Levybacteria bacterium GW2011_GWB1_39_7]
MKQVIKGAFLNALSLFLVSFFLPGLKINGEYINYFYAGTILFVVSIALGPFVKLITMPFNIMTFGLLSFLSTLAALVVLTLVFRNVQVTSFTFNGLSFMGLSINKIFISGVLSYVIISATIYFLSALIEWLFSK